MSRDKTQVIANIAKQMGEYRFYESEAPVVGEMVMARHIRQTESSVTVQLPEFRDREGMLPFTELTRNRVRSFGQFIHIGRIEPMEVLRVDDARGFVDLGRKKMTKAYSQLCKNRFHKAKVVQRIMLLVASLTNVPFTELQEKIIFPMYRDFSHAEQGLRAAYENHEVLDKYCADLPPAVRAALVEQINRCFIAKKVRVRADVTLTCYSSHGVDAIRTVLLSAVRRGDEPPKMPVVAQIDGSPKYRLDLETDDVEVGQERMTYILDMVKKEIEELGGNMIFDGTFTVIGNTGGHEDDDLVIDSGDDE